MKTWILILLLVTGEEGDLPADREMCHRVSAAVAAGNLVVVDLADGRHVQIAAAHCVEIDPETEGPTS